MGGRMTAAFYREAMHLIRTQTAAGKRLHITGIGKPHHIASYMASLFSSIGTACYLLDGTEATHGSSGQVLEGDVVICISYYGNVPELMRTVDTLKRNGAKLIALTGFEDSWIAQQADVHLNCFVEREGDPLGRPPRTSMLATLYVLMGLSLLLQEENGVTPENYVRFHPSG
ncbi:MAG TPA: SIS domain-containing protein, partial [Clostridia bacterium]|nr:SIS domain-containing protein [Clostridia bacterium]